jgi:hypothetical protein
MLSSDEVKYILFQVFIWHPSKCAKSSLHFVEAASSRSFQRRDAAATLSGNAK